MSPAERAVADYVLKHPDEVILLSMRALAEKADVSDNTVLRFCRTSGFSGYWDFKASLVPQIVTQKGSIYQQIKATDQFALQKEKIAANIDSTVKATFQNVVEEDILQIAQKIASSNMTAIVGTGDSCGVAAIFSNFLLMLDIPSVYLSDRSEMERMCNILRGNSVLIGITHSGETPEVLEALKRAKDNDAFTVAICNNLAVRQEVSVDVFLLTQVPTTSVAGTYFTLPRITQLSVIELILGKIPLFIATKEGITANEK
jgi:DNA-binding MurR/RpiR family transcriptional regulator